MGRLYNKLLAFLNISGRDLAVFLLALLLAFSIWLIHNLALKYNAYLDVTVQAKCNIDGHSDLSSDHCSVVARCRTTGYNVIRLDYFGRKDVRTVAFQSSVMKHKDEDVYYVTSSDLQEYAHLIFGDGVAVEYFTTDTLFFRFPRENSKKVPVLPVSSITFMPQYMNDAPMMFQPDSVTVYGEPYLLNTLERVYTEPIRHAYLSKDIAGEVELEKIRGIRFSDDKVHYSMGVTRYVEFSRKLSVNIVNLPSDKTVTIIPSTVNVVLKSSFPVYNDPLESCIATVDYNDYLSSLSGKCIVQLQNLSGKVLDYEIQPSYVEFIVEDN